MSASLKSTRGLRALRINHAVVCAALSAAGMFAGERAFAADITWVRAAGNPGLFSDGANWVGGVAPSSSADSGFINNGGISTVGAPFTGTVNNIGLGITAAGTGTLTQTGGSITATGNATFGGSTTGAGTYIMSGGTLTVTGIITAGSIAFGSNGAGTANISGGWIAGRNVFLGANTNGHGHVVQTGGMLAVGQKLVLAELKPADFGATPTPSDYTMSGGAVTVGGSMYVGAHGPATFNLSGTGSVSVVGAVQIGASGGATDPPAGTGTFAMSGGTLAITGPGAFLVVADHGDGTFNLSGGTVTTKYLNVGQNLESGFSTRGLMNQTGGSVNIEYSWVIAEQSQSANLYDLSGGTVTLTGIGDPLPGDLNVASGVDSRGTLMVRGTGVAKIGNSAMLGNGAGSGGTLIVSANGSLSLGTNGAGNGNLIAGVDGTGTLQVSGGSVIADGLTLGQNAGALGTGTQTGGSVVIRKNMSVGETSTGSNVYDISGGTLNVGAGALGGIFVASSGVGTLKVGGTATVTAPFLANKGAYAQTGGVASMGLVTGIGSISVSGGTLNATSIAQSALSISSTGTAKIAVNGTDTGLSVVDSLSVTGSGRLDLNDNDLIVHNGNYATITTSIRNARNAGAWNQPGITSSTAAAAVPKNKTLGTLKGTEYLAINGATFDSFAVAGTDVLVKYTYYGDTDFNGLVDFDDYSRVDAGFNNNRTGWMNGDVDYNGIVDFDDYSLIDQAFNTQSGTLRRAMNYLDGGDRSEAGMDAPSLQLVMQHLGQFGETYAAGFLAAVPEPTSAMTLLGLAAPALAARRRRR
ncbi:MAG: hypothetical protein H7Z14_00355 [Anaerolineae bacterium]|nr:hypothetical protein [Phycisphaerae bacterium]